MSTADLKTAVTGKAASPMATMQGFLTQHKQQLVLALPKQLNADRMIRLALTAFANSRKLQECTPKSFCASVLTAAQLGLEIGVVGQGWIVPYKKTATFIPGWQGLCDLVTRSGRGSAWTGAVFDGDEFDYAMGDRPFVKHKPMGEDDPAKITHVYAVGRVNGSEWPVIEVWPIRKVTAHRNKYNKVGADHYSYRDWEMYARKVPLLQVLKYMPKSIELQNAVAAADAGDQGMAGAILNGEFSAVEPEGGDDTGNMVDMKKNATNAGDGDGLSMIDDVKRICAAAILIEDRDTAYFRLQDAESLLPGMQDSSKALARNEIDAAIALIKARV